MSKTAHDSTLPGWSITEICGGPHGGTSMILPDDLDNVVLRHGGREHIYARLGSKPQMHHQEQVAQWFTLGGRKR